MRNLVKYPITDQEVLDCLNKLAEQFRAEGRFGDMRPLLLEKASQMVAASKQS